MSPISPSAGPPEAELPDMGYPAISTRTYLYSAYIELPVVQRLLGHVSLMTPAFYRLDRTLYEAYSALAG
jgi:hypothetical protein